jgi:hypothetical protein
MIYYLNIPKLVYKEGLLSEEYENYMKNMRHVCLTVGKHGVYTWTIK